MNHLKLLHCLLAIWLLMSSSYVYSDVYQWTDENGQVHFGDRAPNSVKSTNISNQVNQINITSDLSSPEMMLRQAQEKDAQAKERIEEWQAQQKNKPSQAEACAEAKRYLKVIQGRVVFVDENGKDLKLSEATRKQQAKELNKTIQKYCK